MATFFIGPFNATPAVQVLGGTILISVELRTSAGVLGTPGTSILIQILGPDGAVLVAYVAMTADSTGKYSYAFVSATSHSPGTYSAWVKTTDVAVVSIQPAPYLFELVGLA